MFRFLCAPALLLATLMPAGAMTLDCSIPQGKSTGGFVTAHYIIKHDEASNSAEVYDGLLEHFNGGPMAAKVGESTDKKLAATWEVKIRNGSGQVTIMRFRAAYFKENGKITIRANPAGYDNSFEGRGRCKTVK